MTEDEKKAFWGDTPQHVRDYAERVCAANRKRMAKEKQRRKEGGKWHDVLDELTPSEGPGDNIYVYG